MTLILKDKWALVTGASRGVGQQIALGLAKKGVNLVLHSSSIKNQDKTKALLSEFNVEIKSIESNLEDPKSIQKGLESAEELSGGIDILYNNAAVMTQFIDLFDAPIEDYHKSFQVNVYAVIQACTFFAPKMKARGFGRIINTTSGIKDTPGLDAYSISKAALDKYTRDLAVELAGSNVLANLLDPGWCRTDLGGDQAWNDVKSVLPGALLPAMIGKEGDEEPRGMWFSAQDFAGMDI
ncbi:SDR family NAD(P)-dependent oxidoreductase [Marinicellulosiphila megalodicopiae]|uniref:SDR family NAD(P)-dependent oxidoreductase n=1 Tax=Marinicellulosiphila megalodicopiae TaxID=2724896 RepID=UPI003BAF7D53